MGLDNEDIKQLIAILQKGLTNDDTDDVEDEKPKTSKKSISTSKKKPKHKNLFESMPEKRMHSEDSVIDKKLWKAPPTERSRSYKAINVQCRVCGKQEKLSPALIESVERYKCNRCSTTPG